MLFGDLDVNRYKSALLSVLLNRFLLIENEGPTCAIPWANLPRHGATCPDMGQLTRLGATYPDMGQLTPTWGRLVPLSLGQL